MTILIHALSFVSMLLITLIVHELGHLAIARLHQAKTTGFQIGIGWSLITRHTGRTVIRLTPETKLLNPEATALVFYPTKALANDQARRWRECCQTLGLDGNTVGQIDGDVGTGQRNRILEGSRIMIATPDPALPGRALDAAGRLRRAERPGRPCRGLRDNPEPNPGVLYPSGVQVSMPEPSKQLASALSVQLTRADKDAFDLLAAWPLCTREQLSDLIAVPPWTSCASC